MWKETYKPELLEIFDESLSLMMNASSIQEVVNHWFQNDPPRTKVEYDAAAQYFYERILRSQPFIGDFLLDLSTDQSYKIVKLHDHPFGLLRDWTRTSVAEIAQGNYKNGIAAVLGMQATMCQFGEDEFLKAGAKIGFGIQSLMIPRKILPEYVLGITNTCISHVCGEESRYSHIHSRPAIEFCGTLYELTKDLAMIHHHKIKEAGQVGEKASAEMARITADSFDEKTRKKFQMRRWVEKTLRSWGL